MRSRRASGFWPCSVLFRRNFWMTLPAPAAGRTVPVAGSSWSWTVFGTATCNTNSETGCREVLIYTYTQNTTEGSGIEQESAEI